VAKYRPTLRSDRFFGYGSTPIEETGTQMSTKEQDFKERLVAVMRDVKDNGSQDPEAVWLIGSLATRLIDLYKLRGWSEFKQQLSPTAYDRLLKDFEEQGNGYHKQGNAKAAYAIQLLAISVVCRTQRDPEVREGEKLLDQMINSTVVAYRKASAAEAAKVH
jgi:hypothetical protein